MQPIRFTLPLPPSENRLHRAGPGRHGKGFGLYMSKEAREWYKTTAPEHGLGLIQAERMQAGSGWKWAFDRRQAVHAEIVFHGAKRFDLHNLFTALFNALERGELLENDCQIRGGSWREAPANGKRDAFVEILLTPMTMEDEK